MNKRYWLTFIVAGLLPFSSVWASEWSGDISEDWFTAGNWTAGVPTASTAQVRIDTTNPNAALIASDAAATGNLFEVGRSGTALLNIANGGSLSTGSAILGGQAAGNGTVIISGAGSIWQAAGAFTIGSSGTGDLQVLDGGAFQVSDINNLLIGQQAAGSGSITVSGADSTLVNSGTFWIGSTGTGELTISDGGAVTFAATATVAQTSVSQGNVLISGDGSMLYGTRLHVGNGGNGQLRLFDGGMLHLTGAADSPAANYRLVIGANSGSNGEVVVGGPAGQAPAPPGQLDLRGGILFNNGAGTLVFNHSGDIDLPFPINGPVGSNASGLIRADHGRTLFSGQPLAYSGSLIIEQGATFGAGGQLGDVVNDGRLVASPGQSATLTINGDYSHGEDAVLEIQFAPGPVVDFIDISGEANFAGGGIALTILPGNYGNTPLDGLYPILTAAGGISGQIAELVDANPNAFELIQDGDTLLVNVTDSLFRDRFAISP